MLRLISLNASLLQLLTNLDFQKIPMLLIFVHTLFSFSLYSLDFWIVVVSVSVSNAVGPHVSFFYETIKAGVYMKLVRNGFCFNSVLGSVTKS